MSTVVMKFGGAAVATPEQFSKIAEVVAEERTRFKNLVIVVSAMADMTNQLVELAEQVHPEPPRREYDMLVSVGERISIALLAMALEKRGIPAQSFTGSQSGIVTSDEHSNAHVVDVRPRRLLTAFEQNKVVIVAGFQGCSLRGEITTLGRNGSDISAVALGVALGASEVIFFKDVDGVYSADPKENPSAVHYPTLSYQEFYRTAGSSGVLHSRCVELAEHNALPLTVCSFDRPFKKCTKIFCSQALPPSSPRYEEISVAITE